MNVEVRMAADGYSHLRPLKNANCSLGVAGENADGCCKELASSSEFDLLFRCEKSMSMMRAGWCYNRKKMGNSLFVYFPYYS